MQPIRTMSNLIEKTIISQVGVQNWKASDLENSAFKRKYGLISN